MAASSVNFNNPVTQAYLTAASNKGGSLLTLIRRADDNDNHGLPVYEFMSAYIQRHSRDDILKLYQHVKTHSVNFNPYVFLLTYLIVKHGDRDTWEDHVYASAIAELKDEISNDRYGGQQSVFIEATLELLGAERRKTEILSADIQSHMAEMELLSSPARRRFQVSKIKTRLTTLTYKPRWVGSGINLDQFIPVWGPIVFDRMSVSPDVPFMYYVTDDSGHRIYKVTKGLVPKDDPNYDVIVPVKEAITAHTLVLILWTGIDDNGDSRDTRSMYKEVRWDLQTNTLTVQIPGSQGQSRSLFEARLSAALGSSVVLGPRYEGKIVGDVNLYPRKFDASGFIFHDYIFLHLIVSDPVMSRYIFVEENNKPYAFKTGFRLQYRPAFSDVDAPYTKSMQAYITNHATVSFTLKIDRPVRNAKNQPVVYIDGTEQLVHEDYHHFHIKITKADSLADAKDFARDIRVLMYRYFTLFDKTKSSELKALNRIYSRVGLETLDGVPSKGEKPRSTKGERSHIEMLKEAFPDVFVAGYPVASSRSRQPDITTDKRQLEKWQAEGRQYLPFPPGKPKFWFACMNDSYPFPGISKNNSVNKKTYPFIPQCFIKDQRKKPDYREYYLGETVTRVVAAVERKAISLLTKEVPGHVTPLLNELLLPVAQNSIGDKKRDGDIMMRQAYARVPDHNSLLVCVHSVVANYTKTNAKFDVSVLRSRLAQRIRSGLLKQELYDVDPDIYLRNLADPDVYLDPRLYYRALEEYFNINIVVFHRTSKTLDRIDMPRYRYFHIHPYDMRRKTLLLISHRGTQKKSEVPDLQCEVIFLRRKSKPDVYLFDYHMMSFCLGLYNNFNQTITWNRTFVGNEVQTHTYSDALYRKFDFSTILGSSVVGQYVDAYGKARAFLVRVRYHDEERNVSLIVPPTHPLNVDLIQREDLLACPIEFAQFLLASLQMTGVTRRGPEGAIDGIWFRLSRGLDYGIYVPVATTLLLVPPAINKLQDGPLNPLGDQSENVINVISDLKRTLSFLTQILVWCFTIYVKTTDVDLDDAVTQFTTTYFAAKTQIDKFDVLRLPPLLDSMSDVESAMEHVRKHTNFVKRFTTGKKFVFTSSLMRTRLTEYLTKFAQDTLDVRDLVVARGIQDYFTHDHNFNSTVTSQVFVNKVHLEEWIQSRRDDNDMYLIRTNVDPELVRHRLDPYLVLGMDGVYYLIQNTKRGDLNHAVGLAFRWSKSGLNYGPYVEIEKKGHVFTHSVYQFDDAGLLALVSGDGNDTLKVIKYGERSYGAMLPLLS